MRTVTSNALTQINERMGTEPMILVQIQWDTGVSRTYADKTLSPSIKGKLLQISEIDSVLSLDNYETGSVTITLDDTDGEIKQFIDQIQVHKRPCHIYLHYNGLDLDDKILLFKGEISSPFVWAESDRQVSFDVVTEIEAYEVGFSPEEGQLSFVSPKFLGKPWPLAFGDVKHIPAQKVSEAPTAQLDDRLQIVDPLLKVKMDLYEQAFLTHKMMARFWADVREGVHGITFPIWYIIQEYVRTIQMERSVMLIISLIQGQLDTFKARAKEIPHDRFVRSEISNLENQLDFFSSSSDTIARYKDLILQWMDRATFAVNLARKAAQEQIREYNAARSKLFMWMAAAAEVCRQEQNQKKTLAVSGEIDFPDGTPVDVCIKGVKFRVRFNHSAHTVTILSGPLDQHVGLRVAPWQKDDVPCSGMEALDGMNMFWLRDEVPPNLEGMYLLVRRRANDPGIRHIIKVERQEGRKVYFELVPWDQQNTSGLPRGLSVEQVVDTIVNTPFVSGPLGNPVPADVYRGALYSLTWSRPESAELLGLIARIPGGPNIEELRNLARLVYQRKFDYLRGGLVIIDPSPQDIYTIVGPDIAAIEAASPFIPQSWLDRFDIPYEEAPSNNTYLADTGTEIGPCSGGCEVWIANILPSTIKYVGAYRVTREGKRIFAPVPSRYYKKKTVNMGGYTVSALTFPRPLSNYPSENWEDQIYVSLSSSVGPNVVDVIKWLLETYTDKSVNDTNFNAVKSRVAKYPVGFALVERPNVLEEVKRICWEARLAVYLKEDKYNLIYLSEEPTSVDTISLSDISLDESIKVDHTGTENLMTRIIASFNEHYLPLRPEETLPRVILRNNIQRYGLHSAEEVFHIYNIRSLVEKSATFWLIRHSNTWKNVNFTTFLNKVRLENFDAVTFPGGYFANNDTLILLERVTIDPENYTITFSAATGVRQGEMSQYPFYWPALKSPVSWIEKGIGGYGPGPSVKGKIGC